MQKICVVCIANYCRSPVAEVILKNNLEGKAYVQSCGIDPLPKANMDPRSQKFLNKIGFKNTLHTPQRINNQVVKESDVIYALDVIVLMQLNKLYPRNINKIKLLYLLTVADINGTNKKIWNNWKANLLLELYKKSLDFLSNNQPEKKKR